ncbi:MAG: hypothetical protein KIT43_09890 [Bauldia sp.]|nr:hypothetical protein [Bauldia sp.]
MSDFTTLEAQAFEAMSVTHPQLAEGLRGLLATARVTARDNTGHGFYTRFEVDRSQPPLGVSPPLEGATFNVRAGEEVLLMDFLLWVDPEGHPNCLEGYQLAAMVGEVPSAGPVDLRKENLTTLVRYGR